MELIVSHLISGTIESLTKWNYLLSTRRNGRFVPRNAVSKSGAKVRRVVRDPPSIHVPEKPHPAFAGRRPLGTVVAAIWWTERYISLGLLYLFSVTVVRGLSFRTIVAVA